MITRRKLLEGSVGALFVGCHHAEPASCMETTGLAKEDAKTRVTLGYVDSAPSDKTCVVCKQYVAAPDEGQCGTCSLLKGPIHPRGTCKAFTAKG